MSIHDELTSIFNRRGLEAELFRELTKIRRYDGELTVLMIDCDNFKNINTFYRHAGGDCVLIEVANRKY